MKIFTMINFLNCKIALKEKVLEPRIETEFWVKKAIDEIKKSQKSKVKSQKFKILDVFAGTGCIGIAVLKNIKNSKMDFVDISKEAVEEIKINLKLNGIPKERWNVYRVNIFEKTKKEKYDIIFANPPYVARKRIKEVQIEVLEKDPHIALFGGKDGMIYIKKFLSGVKKYLKPGGIFYLECDPLQEEKIKGIFEKEGFKSTFSKDQFGKWRWVRGQIKNNF